MSRTRTRRRALRSDHGYSLRPFRPAILKQQLAERSRLTPLLQREAWSRIELRDVADAQDGDRAHILDTLRSRPPMQHAVVTGRGAPAELIELADTVTDMRAQKHAFDAGIGAQPGIEL